MPLLAEYALTPDVFDSTSYSTDEMGRICLQHLKEVLVSEGIVRDLRDGNWSALFSDDGRPWHMRGKELLEKLRVQNRLRRTTPSLANKPTTDHEWCEEALASHDNLPLSGIVATRDVAADFGQEPLVARIDRLSSVPWWAGRSSSVRLTRRVVEYIQHLELVLACANSVMYIDPHLDPTRRRYRDFLSLVLRMAGRTLPPLVEVHRVCYFGSGPDRQLIEPAEWESRFSGAWSSDLRASGGSVEVFIWDDFHDRYLISDLVGISVPNGFDTTTATTSRTTWTRLGREDRDDIQREFDPADNRHNLRHRFTVPS